MLGSGIFVLPGLAAAKTGPMVWLAYLVAGLTVLPAALSKSELATAMPTSGGTYVYLERTFGPLTGTISGIGLWLSLLLKSAFALVGFSAYLSVLVEVPLKPVSVSLLVAVTILNIMGVSIISQVQKYVLAAVLVALFGLTMFALPSIDPTFLDAGFSKGLHGFLAATAFVYVSYAGVTKIAAIAEEVKNPNRNLPLGILISWFTVMCIYVGVVFVLVTNVPLEQLIHADGGSDPDLHPIYTLAKIVGGPAAGTVAAVLAVATMVSMAVAGLLAASRFPFAMSRDQLLPEQIKLINPFFKTPVNSILLTALVMAVAIMYLPVEQIAKLASAFMILAFIFVCVTVIVLREVASSWYKPGFRSPLYPFVQILGIVSGIVLLSAMGLTSLFAIGCIVLVGAGSYFGYGRRKTSRRGVVGKMGKRKDLIVDSSSAAPLDPELEHAHTLDEELPAEAAVVVPLFGTERSPETLVEMGASLAHDRKLEILHISAVPEQVYLADALEEDQHTVSISRRIHAMAEEKGVRIEYDKTVSRDVVHTIHEVAARLDCEWVVMEASGRRNFGVAFQNPLGWLQDHLACNLAVFKDAGVRYIRQILVFPEPGPHDSLVVTTADHLAKIYNAELNFFCFVEDGADSLNTQTRRSYIQQMSSLCVSPTRTIEVTGATEMEAVLKTTSAYDLMIMGAAPNRSMTARLFGSAKDKLTRKAECSVLWLKTPFMQTHELREAVKTTVEQEFDLMSFVDVDCVQTNLAISKKEAVFQVGTDLLAKHYPDISPIIIKSSLWEREQVQNTSVGDGVAIPHAILSHGKTLDTAVAILTLAEPIDYGSLSQNKVDVLFFATGTVDDRQTHLKILADIAKLCANTNFLEQAREATNNEELIASLKSCLSQTHPKK